MPTVSFRWPFVGEILSKPGAGSVSGHSGKGNMMEQKPAERTTVVTTGGGGGAGWFIVGALVVAAIVAVWLFGGGMLGGGDKNIDVNVDLPKVETPADN